MISLRAKFKGTLDPNLSELEALSVNLRSAYPAIVHTTRASLYVIHSQLKLCVLGSSHFQLSVAYLIDVREGWPRMLS